MAEVAAYPTPSIGGPRVNRLINQPIDYKQTRYEFEDGGCDVNVQPCGIRRWILEYEGLSEAEVVTLRDHFNLAKNRVDWFDFFHSRDAVTYENVYYESWKLGRHPKRWANALSVTLLKLI